MKKLLPRRLEKDTITNGLKRSTRGGPDTLEELKLTILVNDSNYLVINKGPDTRLDGVFDATIEKALHRDYPAIDKFRWIHQLDFATSGAMCIGLNKPATAAACRLFREKKVQKEYLALVDGHMPWIPPSDMKKCHLDQVPDLVKQSQATNLSRKHHRGAPSGPALFQMDQSRLRRRKNNGESLNVAETRTLNSKWKQLSLEERKPYLKQHEKEQKVYEAEIAQIPIVAEPVGDSNSEIVGYLFDASIAEPANDFRMQIGSTSLPGKPSATIAFVLEHGTFNGKNVSKVLLRPLTGRRHQLRVHLSSAGFPIVGDVTYGDPDDEAYRMMLHAWKLQLLFSDQPLTFEAPEAFDGYLPIETRDQISTL